MSSQGAALTILPASESGMTGALCGLSRHGERFAWLVKHLVRLLQSCLKGYGGQRQLYFSGLGAGNVYAPMYI